MQATVALPPIFWLFPIAFTLHNLEEAIWMPAFSKTAGRLHRPVGTFEFIFALIPITALGWLVTLLFYAAGPLGVPCHLFFAFNLAMLVNVFFPHLAATVALRRYCPGLATGLLLLAPVNSFLLIIGFRHGYFAVPELIVVTAVFAGLVAGAIPLLFRAGRWVHWRLQDR